MALLASTQGRGQDVWNADEFRWGGAYLWRIKQRFAPHNVYTDGAHLQALAAAVGAPAVPDQAPALAVPADIPLAKRPDGGLILVPYLANRIEYAYDRTTNTVPAHGHRRRRAGRRRNEDADRPEERPDHDDGVCAAQRRERQGPAEAAQVGSGPAWIATGGRTVQGTWEGGATLTAPTLFFGRTAFRPSSPRARRSCRSCRSGR